MWLATSRVLTEPFGDQVDRMIAYQRTDLPLRAVTIPHPIQNVSADEMQHGTEAIVATVEKLLRGEEPV